MRAQDKQREKSAIQLWQGEAIANRFYKTPKQTHWSTFKAYEVVRGSVGA